MSLISYRTKFVNKESVNRNWYLVDAEGLVLGRLASEIAKILRGKNKPDFTPHYNSGDKVVVINAEKVRLTGNKMDEKEYMHYTGYPGGQRTENIQKVLKNKPTEVLNKAISGMLPKTRLRKEYLRNLHIYAGGEHPHQAQNPVKLEL